MTNDKEPGVRRERKTEKEDQTRPIQNPLINSTTKFQYIQKKKKKKKKKKWTERQTKEKKINKK